MSASKRDFPDDPPEGTPQETSKEDPRKGSRETLPDALKEALKDALKDALRDALKDAAKDAVKESSKEHPEESSKDITKGSLPDAPNAAKQVLKDTISSDAPDHTANNPADDFPRKYLKNYSASSSIYSRDDTPNDTSSYAPDQSASDSHDKSLRGKTASSSVYSRDDLPEVVPESSSKDINAPSHSNDVTETFKDKSTDSGNDALENAFNAPLEDAPKGPQRTLRIKRSRSCPDVSHRPRNDLRSEFGNDFGNEFYKHIPKRSRTDALKRSPNSSSNGSSTWCTKGSSSGSSADTPIESPTIDPSHDLSTAEKGLAHRREDNLVDYDGPDDPENPFNWPSWKKTRQLVLMAMNSFITPLASSMFAPGVSEVMKEFHSSNTVLASFIVTVYILGYMVGPFLVAPLSEIYGRVPVYHVCNVLFLIFTVACALAQSLPQLIVFRLLAGIAGVCPLTIGSGTVSDMVPKEKRAGILSIWALGPILGPVIGPVAGGFLTEAEGWRWVFWVISITTGVITILCMVFYRESYAPVILDRKAARLRKSTGNQALQSIHHRGHLTVSLFMSTLSRPIKLLTRSPSVFLFASYAAISYGYMYLLFTTLSSIFELKYGFSVGLAGLSYLGFGIGELLGVFITGRVANRIAVRHVAQGRFTPESRLPPMLVGCWLMPAGLFWYGWAAQAAPKVHWAVPLTGTAVFGGGLMSVFLCANFYLVDLYLQYTASVVAAGTVVRSLVGAVLPLAGPKMYKVLGLGWGNSLLAFVALAMCAAPVLFSKYGARIRQSPRFQVKL